MESIISLDKQYVANTYARFPVELVSGKGNILTDVNGKQYIDMGSGIGVTAFGIAEEAWMAAVTAQLGTLQHTSNLYYTQPCARLARLLCEKTGMKKVFFSNSGAEANECAIKAARKYSAEKKGADCYTVVTLVNSFHGRTLTTLSATGQDHFHKLFNPLTPGFVHVAAEDIEGLTKLVREEKIAGIMLECVQGEGGVVALSREFVRAAAELAASNDIPLIIDEVQTGNGRTGSLYAYMDYGITPDIVSTAKGLGGGLPIGATLLGEKVESVLGFGDHGSTYGGNPVCCAGALSVIERLDEAFLAQVREKSDYVFQELTGAKGIVSVTGKGLMIGIKTQRPAKEVVADCMEQGVLCLTAKDKVRLLPALNIPMDVLKKAVGVIKSACADIKE
ncbi:MAG: acetylornithine/succinylornithine family transaminase [Oscillospiraceae bacterium]|nr:acetylornithine/succinylornithine family transaminase [Oscillospiraceae bacterium]